MIEQEALRRVVAQHQDVGIPKEAPACSCGWSGDIGETHAEHLGDVIIEAVTGAPGDRMDDIAG